MLSFISNGANFPHAAASVWNKRQNKQPLSNNVYHLKQKQDTGGKHYILQPDVNNYQHLGNDIKESTFSDA